MRLRKITVIISGLCLSGCVTTKNAVSLSDDTAKEAQEYGVLAYNFAHVTENPEGYFPYFNWQLVTGRYTLDEEDNTKKILSEIRWASRTDTSELPDTAQSNKQAKDFAYVYEPGNHLIMQGSLYSFMKTMPHTREIVIKPNTVTYIGDFIYESTSTGNSTGYDVKRLLLEIKCDPDSFAQRFKKDFPNHSDKKIYNACSEEGRFRKYPANDSVYMHVSYTPAQ